MNLLIDIGNTFTHIGIAGETHIANDFKFPTHSKIVASQVLKKLGGYKRKIKNAAITSVVPQKTAHWKEFVSKYLNVRPLILSAKVPLPLKINVKRLDSVGGDRICGAVGGYFFFKGKSNVIVVDLGTATTYNVILKNGEFEGGVISPGIETSAKALHLYTGRLPLLKARQFIFPRRVVGRSTVEAIQSGLMYAASFSIDGMIKEIEKEYRCEFKVILTGGNAARLNKRIEHNAKSEKFLVFLGLNRILQYNLMV